jgi:hypothetical protein
VAQLTDEVGAVKVAPAKYGDLDAAARVRAIDTTYTAILEARHDPPRGRLDARR